MKFWVKVESQEKRVDIENRDGIYTIDIDGKIHTVDCRNAGHRDYLSLIIDKRSHFVESGPIKVDEGKYYANIGGRRYEVEVLDERLVATRQIAGIAKNVGPYVVSSPMPGLIVDVRVGVGDRVEAGSAVVIMEAMKMQNELITEVDGVVRAVNIQPADAVDSQVPLIEIDRAG